MPRRLTRYAVALISATAIGCSKSSPTNTEDSDRVNVEVHNTGTRTVTVTVKTTKEESLAETLTAAQLLADDYAGDVGGKVTVTVTSPAAGGAPAATGSGFCTAKSPIINSATYGIINVTAGTGATITVTCVGSANWNEGT